jgi:hypothetical protein
MDAGDIIYHLQKCRERMPEKERGQLNALIEELVKGYGAAKPRGGDRRSEKANGNQSVSTYGLKRSKGGASPVGLAARLAESSDEGLKAWTERKLAKEVSDRGSIT